MVSKAELAAMAGIDITRTDRRQLTDISAVSINQNVPAGERLNKFVQDTRNPYCFMSGKTPVKIEFAQAGRPLDETLTDYFIGLKNR